MNVRSLVALFPLLLFGMAAAAQTNCPKERAAVVPRQIITGSTQDCAGIQVNIGGVQVASPQGGCPLFIIYEPEHHAAVPSKLETMVEPIGHVDVTHLSFECQNKWFLFVPYDAACRQIGSTVMAALPLLRTIPCPLQGEPSSGS